jgi:predicted nucleic acid-binding protein
LRLKVLFKGEASRAMGCTQVLSEDLSDGQDYAGVQVTNPFR